MDVLALNLRLRALRVEQTWCYGTAKVILVAGECSNTVKTQFHLLQDSLVTQTIEATPYSRDHPPIDNDDAYTRALSSPHHSRHTLRTCIVPLNIGWFYCASSCIDWCDPPSEWVTSQICNDLRIAALHTSYEKGTTVILRFFEFNDAKSRERFDKMTMWFKDMLSFTADYDDDIVL